VSNSHVVIGKQFHGEKWHVVMMQQRAIFSKVQGKIIAHFHVVATEVTLVFIIDCLDYQDEIFMNIPLDVKANDEHALDSAFHLSHSPVWAVVDFSVQTPVYCSCFLP
jgi:hypothetical protein